MDLGATVCLPKGKIDCASCPISSFCKAHRGGNPEDYPKRRTKKPRKIEKYSIFVFREGDRIALVKRPKKGVLAGLYAFYQVAGHVSKKEALEEARKLGFSALKLRELGATRHIFTHKEWDMIGYEIDLGEFPEAVVKEEGFRFYTREEIKNNLSIPSAYGFYKSFVLS